MDLEPLSNLLSRSKARYPILLICFFTCAPISAVAQLRIQGLPEVQADKTTGAGTTLLVLRNESTAAINATLSTGPVTTKGTASATEAQVFFAPENDTGSGESTYTFALNPAATVKVRVLVIKAWGSSPLSADLQNGPNRIGGLVIFPSALNVGLAEPAPEKPDFNLTDGDPARIILKNSDTVSYALAFRLILDKQVVAGHEFQIAGHGSAILDFVPRMNIDWTLLPTFVDRLREIFKPPSVRAGTLFLYQKQGSAIDYSMPAAMIRVNASFSYFSPEWRSTLNYVLIITFLVLGGVASLIFGHSLPNLLDRLSVVENLNSLARITANLSSNIGSQLGVLIRLQRSRLRDLLKTRTTISPDFSTTLALCKAGAAKLSARVALVQQLDVAIGRLTTSARRGAPPSRIEEIRQSLQQASETLKKDDPGDPDLQDAQKRISAALMDLDSINQPNPDFGKRLAQRVHETVSALPAKELNPTFERICGLVPGPVAVLKLIPAAGTEVTADSYGSVDRALAKTKMLLEYAGLIETTGGDATDRMQKRESRLVSDLNAQSWEDLQDAMLLLREMNDDLYPERLLDALTADPLGAFIRMEPAIAYEEEPLEFSIYFSNHFINTAAAREEWTCTWEFGDGLKAEGWVVSHYFMLSKPDPFQSREERKFKVSVSFRDATGKIVAQAGKSEPVTVTEDIIVRPSRLRVVFGERTVAEVARLSAALLVAVFALVAGAKTQLEKLDLLQGLVAVFVAGYGVDVVKNLMNSGQSSGKT